MYVCLYYSICIFVLLLPSSPLAATDADVDVDVVNAN